MTLSQRIWTTMGMIGAVTAIISGSYVLSSRRVADVSTQVVTDSLPGVYAMGHLQVLKEEMQKKMIVDLALPISPATDSAERYIDQLQSAFRSELAAYGETSVSSAEKDMYQRLSPAFDAMIAGWREAKTAAHAGQAQEALSVFQKRIVPAGQVLQNDLREEYEFNKANADRSTAALVWDGSSSVKSAWFLCALAALSLVGGGWFIAYTTTTLTKRLREGISQLSSSAMQIASAAGQVASSSQTLAQGASEQAATLEETAASGQEVNALTKQGTDNSHAAAALMGDVDERITRANSALELLVASMGQIGDSSERIAGIIKVIDDIAFQTNILALNAAVEAARAGEAGMGFAVVADEVRNLAQRCATAAKDTTNLIKEAAENAKGGRVRLDEVSTLIQEITKNSVKVKALVDEVSHGSSEQSRGVTQISRAIDQLEKVTQQNAANAEESAAASQQLSSQASVLQDVVAALGAILNGSRAKLAESRQEIPAHREEVAAPVLVAEAPKHAAEVHAVPVSFSPRAPIDRSSFPLDDSEFQSF